MKKEICWILALVLTFYLSVLQLIMSSTFPLDAEVNTGKQKFQIQLIRSFTGTTDCPIVLPIEDISVTGYILYHLNKDSVKNIRLDFKREGDKTDKLFP